MIIVDPVTLGDVACSRPSPKWVFDRTGTLVQVPADTLAVTYDPADLSAAPRPLYEVAATNLITGSEDLSGANWWAGAPVSPTTATYRGIPYVRVAKGSTSQNESRSNTFAGITAGDKLVLQMALRADTADKCSVGLIDPVNGTLWGPNANATARIVSGPGAIVQATGALHSVTGLSRTEDTLIEITRVYPVTQTAGVYIYPGTSASTTVGDAVLVTRVQGEKDRATSYIPTGFTQVTRAADVIAPGAGLVYSNVPITEARYDSATTFALGAQVYDPVTFLTYQSAIAGNVGKPLTDTASWLPLGTVVNRRKMLDQYNNTQTTNPDEILMAVSPQAISQGLYLGNLYADEVRISVVDKVEGLVYSETKALIESNSGSSFFNWAFKRIRRKDYFFTLKLPVYANALVTISLRKIGGVAKCGMCAIGPTDEFGPTLMGLSTEGKDYSSTLFNFDGTSSTTIRPYAKRMSCDVMVDNDQIDYLQARLFEVRQKPIVWVGGPYGSTAVYGRYESFKNTIPYATRSLMNLTIGGAV
jgi:hypothetical protein